MRSSDFIIRIGRPALPFTKGYREHTSAEDSYRESNRWAWAKLIEDRKRQVREKLQHDEERRREKAKGGRP
jgi:hypothetical protein